MHETRVFAIAIIAVVLIGAAIVVNGLAIARHKGEPIARWVRVVWIASAAIAWTGPLALLSVVVAVVAGPWLWLRARTGPGRWVAAAVVMNGVAVGGTFASVLWLVVLPILGQPLATLSLRAGPAIAEVVWPTSEPRLWIDLDAQVPSGATMPIDVTVERSGAEMARIRCDALDVDTRMDRLSGTSGGISSPNVYAQLRCTFPIVAPGPAMMRAEPAWPASAKIERAELVLRLP